MAQMTIEYLGKPEIDALALTNDEILSAVEQGLIAAGKGHHEMELAPITSERELA